MSHAKLVSDLFEASMLPKYQAVIKVKGHEPGDPEKAYCNTLADGVDKWAAKNCTPLPFVHKNSHSLFVYLHTL